MFMDQGVKVQLKQEETRSMKRARGIRGGCCLLPILFYFTANTSPRMLSKFLETLK